MSIKRPTWSIARAASECGVSVSTIKRRLRDGRFPNAVQGAGAAWSIPVQDLISAGLTPGKPALPDRVNDPGQHVSGLDQRPGPDELLNRISELEQELKLERYKRESLEILLKERADHVASLKQAMRIIEPGQKTSSMGQSGVFDGSAAGPSRVAEDNSSEPTDESPIAVAVPVKRHWWQLVR